MQNTLNLTKIQQHKFESCFKFHFKQALCFECWRGQAPEVLTEQHFSNLLPNYKGKSGSHQKSVYM